MPLPYPENLTPDAPPYSSVQINEYWWSVIFGFGDSALIRENWDVTDQQWDDEVKPAIINALDTAMNCDCISGLSFDPATGKLTYTDQDSNTVTVQTAGDTFISNTYYVITANEADADDAYCYAAHLLAERTSDDLQDMLEILDILEDATVSVLLQIIASTIDLVPAFGDLAEAAVRITDNLTEEIADWVKDNVRDIQARDLATEIFYCGIKIAMENGGQGSLRAGILQAIGDNLVEFDLEFINALWELPDLLPVFTDAFDALDGELLGYAIVSWFLLSDALLDVFGADRPIEAIIAHATKHAAAHDDRDCASFACQDWCHVFDFSEGQQGWGVEEGSFVGGEFVSEHIAASERVRINLDIAPTFDIKSIRVKWSATLPGLAGSRFVQVDVSPTTYKTLSQSAGSFDTVEISDRDAIDWINIRIHTNDDAASTNKITEVEVCGTGTNPF